MGRVRNSKDAHRSGPLKQSNKKHKTGRHRSKGNIDKEGRGRTASISSLAKRHKMAVGRTERRKQAVAIRDKKIQEVLEQKKRFGGLRGAPITIAIVPLSSLSNPVVTLKHILDKVQNDAKLQGTVGDHTAYLRLANGKNVTIVVPTSKDIWCVLDLMKLADITLLHAPDLESLSEETVTLLRAAKEQGIVSPHIGVTSPFSKAQEKAFVKSLNKLFISATKVHHLQTGTHIINALRVMTSAKLSTPKQWAQRSSVLIEETKTVHLTSQEFNKLLPGLEPEDRYFSLLHVTGTVRKRNLNPQRLVHITGVGDFRILRVDVNPIEDVSTITAAVDSQADTPSIPPRFLYDQNAVLPEDLETITSSQAGSDMEDMSEDESVDSDKEMDEAIESLFDRSPSEDASEKSKKRNVPKGTSEYQADWLDQSGSDEGSASGSDDEMEYETASQDESQADADDGDDEDWEDEQEQLKVAREARTEAEFPDWVDTPMDRPAKDRFQRYRGLQSFKKTAWDPYENLPREYAKIFQFANYRQSHKKAVNESDEGAGYIPVGQRVSIYLVPETDPTITNVIPPNAVNSVKPLTLTSHLRHEGKLSVLNVLLNVSDVIKNKEELVFQVGPRRFLAKPILSDCSPGNKHKMLRFAQANTSCVATVIAPVVFPTASVLVFRVAKSSLVFVGGGSVQSVDPTRIITKRVLLSGYPFRVNGKKAVVRFMFFNRDDIEWFKPVELRTRYGRRGHIREPLGTHGQMKCIFDGPMKSQDTVLMPLYKRVFPKFSYDPYVGPFFIYDHYEIKHSVLGTV